MNKYSVFFCLFLSAIAFGTTYEYKYTLTAPIPVITDSTSKNIVLDSMCYFDSKIDIKFTITDKEVKFKLENKTEKSMDIMWDSVNITRLGYTSKIIHRGIKL